jgi:inhibitor of KinA
MVSLRPLGDQAVLASFDNERSALQWAEAVRQFQPPWLVDVVAAYATVAVYFDLAITSFGKVVEALPRYDVLQTAASDSGKLHLVPCCYQLQLDLERVAQHTGLSPEQVIALHSSVEYRVYAIGFCPGFPYLGYLPSPLCDVPRLPSPRMRVAAGSVGLTGRQTGIYTLERPAGWNLIGRTPLCLVDVAAEYFPLRTGDRLRFVPIEEEQFRILDGRRL